MQEGNSTNLDAAIESLLNVEKQMRLAGDVAGTRKAAIDIVELCYKAGAWKTLNDQIVVLSKRRGQLKQVKLSSSPIFGLRLVVLVELLAVFSYLTDIFKVILYWLEAHANPKVSEEHM